MQLITAEAINLERLRTAAGRTIFEQGQAYLQKGRVSVEEVTPLSAVCSVRGSQLFKIDIRLVGNYLQFKCNCRYASRGVFCEHDVAAALALKEYLRDNAPLPWKSQLGQLLEDGQTVSRRRSPQPYLLFFSLQQVSIPGSTTWKVLPYQLPLSSLPKELRPERDALQPGAIQDLLEKFPGLSAQARSPYNALNPAGCINCPTESVVLANVMTERTRAYSYYYFAFPLADYLALISTTNSPLFLGSTSEPVQKELHILEGAGELRIDISRDQEGVRLKANIVMGQQSLDLNEGEAQIVCTDPLWFVAGEYLLRMHNESRSDLLTPWLEQPQVIVPSKDEAEFLEKYYLPLAEQIPLQGECVSWETVQSEAVRRLYLSDTGGVLAAQLRFGYGDFEVGYDARLPAEAKAAETLQHRPGSWTLVRIRRQPQVEEQAFKLLSSSAYGLKRAPASTDPGQLVLRARVHPIDFLMHHVPNLVKAGFEIYGEEQLKTARVNRNKPTFTFSVSSGIDWFDVRAAVNFGEIQVSLKEIRRILRKKGRYVKLADGTIGEIPEEWIERYKHLFALGEENGEGMRLSNHHLTLVDQLLAEADRAQVDREFRRRRQRLQNFNGVTPKELPQGFKGELRPYQKAGYDWLHFLEEFGFGGCLADDMGLGKTVQVLAFLQSLYQAKGARRPASLVVVPRSLLVNWQREASRFTPGLRILEYFDQDRPQETAAFDRVDLVITTYGVMLRDIEKLRKYVFDYALLDESQAIKNPISQTAKAARLLRARRRLVLTGTPVENSSIELWSQFAFLNPGLLGSLDYFNSQFSAPIEKKGDEKKAVFLRKMVYPFILRRTKDQVAPELPPRSERILFSDMEPAQRKLYNRTRDYYRGMLLGMLEKEGMQAARMKVLEGLLRLRQISNHPRLVDGRFHGASGKFDLLLDTLETLKAEGHKALVFSQFVQMLGLVREELDGRKIPYAYLDGHTRDRQDRVDEFQNEPRIPFFLISLKAGGIGLNLTAADYVIHIDPWWNPAVEMQASDRTHRIGQDKPVFVYKLIARDSVEEKILQLQERKKNLVEQLIATEGSFFKDLSPQDVELLFS